MADVTVTAASIKLLSGPTARRTAKVASSHGQVVYQSTTTDQVDLADADAIASGRGIGLILSHLPNEIGDTAVAAGEVVDIALPGAVVTGFSGLVTGDPYYVSTASGKICPWADVTSGDFPNQFGIAFNATDLLIALGTFYTTGIL